MNKAAPSEIPRDVPPRGNHERANYARSTLFLDAPDSASIGFAFCLLIRQRVPPVSSEESRGRNTVSGHG